MLRTTATTAAATATTASRSKLSASPEAAAPQRVLVFHVGSLGDTLVALPSFWAVRDAFPQAHRVMLTKRPARTVIPVGRDILEGSGLFDDYLLFDGDHHAYGHNPPRWRKWLGALNLVRKLRAGRFDLAVYLAPSARNAAQVRRDQLFFRLAGIRRVIGAQAPQTESGAAVVLEAERVLLRLVGTQVKPAALNRVRRDLALTPVDRSAVDRWLVNQPCAPSDAGPWVAFSSGANVQSKQWPADRFEAVGQALIERFNIWPVIVGGGEDAELADRLLRTWGRGVHAAGMLPVRQSAALLERCALFIGNDTGTMHLAASCDVPCVALFSARDIPGKWAPMGERHHVLRKQVPCAGCMLVRCDAQDRLCMRLIAVDEVVAAAALLLKPAVAWSPPP